MIIFKISISLFFLCAVLPVWGRVLDLSTVHQTTWGQSVYVVGNHPFLGDNDPAKGLKLSPHEYPTWKIRIHIENTALIHYRFFIKDDGPDIQGPPIWIGEWQDSESVDTPSYELRIISRLTSQFLIHARDIFIFAPKSLNTTKKTRLLYFHDGQNLFTETATARNSFEMEKWLPRLAQSYPQEQIIVIGIGNTENRMREYVPPYSNGPEGAGIGNLYGRFIIEELIPYIEHQYLKLADISERSLGGASLGGLISVYLAANYPNFFTNALSLSGSFQFAEVAQDLDKLAPERQRIYLDNGNNGPGNDNYYVNYFMRDKFLAMGWIYGGNLLHIIGNGQQHNEEAWRQRLPSALLWVWALNQRKLNDIHF